MVEFEKAPCSASSWLFNCQEPSESSLEHWHTTVCFSSQKTQDKVWLMSLSFTQHNANAMNACITWRIYLVSRNFMRWISDLWNRKWTWLGSSRHIGSRLPFCSQYSRVLLLAYHLPETPSRKFFQNDCVEFNRVAKLRGSDQIDEKYEEHQKKKKKVELGNLVKRKDKEWNMGKRMGGNRERDWNEPYREKMKIQKIVEWSIF